MEMALFNNNNNNIKLKKMEYQIPQKHTQKKTTKITVEFELTDREIANIKRSTGLLPREKDTIALTTLVNSVGRGYYLSL